MCTQEEFPFTGASIREMADLKKDYLTATYVAKSEMLAFKFKTIRDFLYKTTQLKFEEEPDYALFERLIE
jgi:hypothetical protein